MRRKTLFLLIICLICSCDLLDMEDAESGLKFDQELFDKNRELWNDHDYSAYCFTQKFSSDFTGPQPRIKVTVANEKLETLKIVDDAAYSDEDIYNYDFKYFETITELYEYIEGVVADCKRNIYSDDRNSMTGAEIKIEYDSKYNFPVEVRCVGYYKESVDGGLSISISITDFEVY